MRQTYPGYPTTDSVLDESWPVLRSMTRAAARSSYDSPERQSERAIGARDAFQEYRSAKQAKDIPAQR